MKRILPSLMLLMLAVNSHAQTTLPASSDLASLQKEVADLRETISVLKAQNEALKKKLDELSVHSIVKMAANNFSSRASSLISSRKFDSKTSTDILNDAKRVDQVIAKYIQSHNVTPEMQTEMFAGNPKPGMSEDQIKTFGAIVQVEQEDLNGKKVQFVISEFNGRGYELQIQNSIVSSLSQMNK